MNLEEKILQKSAEWRPTSRQNFSVADEAWAFNLTADRCDEIGAQIWEASFRRVNRVANTLNELRSWAERIAGKIVGLLEPLEVIEVDAQRNEAILRSTKPARRGDKLFYYELLLGGTNAATLRRIQGPSQENSRREQVTYVLTHEVLARLATDVTGDK